VTRHRPQASISIIIPTLDEEASIARVMRSCREAGPCEVIVGDGGSRDRTVEIARGEADAVIAAPPGRAAQMNAGAAIARGEVLLFLHADTLLPGGSVSAVLGALKDPAVIGGAFRVRVAASPGARCRRQKFRTTMARTIGTAWSSRRPTYRTRGPTRYCFIEARSKLP